MKLLVVTALLLIGQGTMSAKNHKCFTDKEKEKKEVSDTDKKNGAAASSKNFHSIKKWKMTIEYKNGDIISKIIEVGDNSSISAMETAFAEAEKYIKTLSKVKGYEISPISNNKYVLLATN